MSILNQSINGYHFLEFVGSGGFGSVYKAEKEGKQYAIKAFREEYILQEYQKNGENNRIKREIEIMKMANHPSLIKYVDDFKAIDTNVPFYFLVMEFAPGKTLRKLLDEKSITSEKQTIEIFLNILQGIKSLHNIKGSEENTGIIHRDLKPENIMVDGTSIKVLDYGISKIIDYTALTSTGNFLGSPLYASPEQITDSRNIDKRSDIYALGVILYEMLTQQTPYEYSGLPDLIDKIKNQSPIPPRKFYPNITNKLENIIFKLLEKHPFQRFQNIDDLTHAIAAETDKSETKYDLSPHFVLRLYDDGGLLKKFIADHTFKIHVEFPAIHQFRQKALLQLVQTPQFEVMVDPETVRFAYSTYTDREGLKKLSYCPANFEVITPSYLNTYKKQQKYVQQVLDEEATLGADIFVSPFHYTHNTSVLPTYKSNPVEQWFDLDIKLLKESIDYKNSQPAYKDKKLYAGICIDSNSLTDNSYKNDLLNYYSAHECDGYMVYADGITKETNSVTLFHYIDTLLKLQNNTGRPVIAGRLNSLGLGLLSLGIAGYSSGAARFESFSEDLHKDASNGYNLYERYYFQKLLGTISIERKLPTKLNQITKVIGACQCLYCMGKSAEDVIIAQNNKLHFLHIIHKEVEELKANSNKKEFFLKRIDEAILNYQRLPHVFKKDDFRHLSVWKEVFKKF